jgi:hypothetical protein
LCAQDNQKVQLFGTATFRSRVARIALNLFLVSSSFAGEIFEDTIERTIPLRADGTFSLRSIDGSVEIYGAEANEVKIVAVRKAFSLERLNGIQLRISGHDDAVKVEAIAPQKPRSRLSDRSGTVDFIINLPQHARIASVEMPTGELIIHGMQGGPVHASLENGRLTSHNCYCDQDLRVHRGKLDLFFDWSDERPIAVNGTITNGNILAVVPGDSSFRLHSVSQSGHVVSDFTEMEERKPDGVAEIDQVIGPAPISRLILHATQGNIQILEGP